MQPVQLPIDGTPTVASRWLRDRCECSTCRRSTTNERLLDPLTIDPVVTVDSVTVERSRLIIEFSDGHRGHIGLASLTNDLARIASSDPVGSRTPWQVPHPWPLAVFSEPDLDDPTVLLAALDAVAEHGAVIVRNVRCELDAAVALAQRIGHVLPSNYGPAWEIEANPTPTSEVDSQHGLAVHTDLPYRTNPPGLQVNLFACADVAGGASTLADGIALAEQLRADDPDGWHLLSTVRFTYDYRSDGVRFHAAAPLISLDANSQYAVFRRAPDLVGVPLVDPEHTDAVYAALDHWNQLLDDPAHQLEHRLEAGDAIIFDNHRLLHGRTPFELGSTGRRHLVGCYLEADELVNRRNVLRHELA